MEKSPKRATGLDVRTRWHQNVMRIMKLSVFFLLVFLQVSAHTTGQINLSVSNQPLDAVFQLLRKRTDYKIFAKNQDLEGTRKVTFQLTNASIEQVMQKTLDGQPLTYTIKDKSIFISRIASASTAPVVSSDRSEFAPDPIDIVGQIFDEEGNPVSSASIKIKGVDNGVVSDVNGKFILRNVQPNSTLIISAVNIETTEYKTNPNNNDKIVIYAKSQINPLQEVIYKGYYYEKRDLSVSSTVKIKGSDIAKQPVENPLLALQGRVPGLIVSQTNGVSGGTIKVQIRGQNSLSNGSDPLYIIDGVPINSQMPPGIGNILGVSSTNYDAKFSTFGNPLSYINPSDIENIEVLKDADATAIYGSRAANGAILITTKRGKAGNNKFDLTAQTGVGSVTRRLDLLNLRQYLDMRYEAFKNDNLSPNPNSHFDLTFWDTTRETNWQKEIFGKNANYHDVQTSLSGGTEQVQYLIGAGYHKESSVLPGNYANQKTSVHFALTTTTGSGKFKSKISGNYMHGDNKLPQEDPTRYIYLAPNAPKLFNSDGSLNWEPRGTRKGTWENPLAYIKRRYRNQTANLVANANLSYSLFKFLELRTSLGYNTINLEEVSSVPTEGLNPQLAAVPNSQFNNGSVRSWIIEPQLNFTQEFGKHKIETLLGMTWQYRTSNSKILRASDFSSDALLNNPQAANVLTITLGDQSLYKYTAVYGRFHYSFDDRYILNLTARRDGSSRFGPANRFQNFGAIGAGWVFTNEKWLKELSFLSFGKIRTSWGTTGSDQIGDYRFLDLYSLSSYLYQGVRGLSITNLFNPELAWEQTRKFEIGGELGFFNDRIFLSANYYDNKSDNQLVGYSLASTTGFRSISANQDAVVKNWGWEFALTSAIIKTNKFSWTTSFNISKIGNKIQSLGEHFFGSKTREGQSVNATQYYRYAGINPDKGEYQFLDKLGKPTNQPDTMFWMDLTPSFYGGIQNSISYKRFQLDFLFQFVKQRGQDIFLGFMPGIGGARSNQPTSVLDRWSSSNPNGTIQRFSQNGSINNLYDMASNSDFAYGDASFVRLKNVNLSYQIASSAIRPFRQIRLFMLAQNLLTITKYKGLDPETRGFATLPPLRTITAGVQFSL